MASNPLALLPLAEEFNERLWVFLRCFLNQEVVRRVVSLTYLYKENLLNFCMFDEDFLNYETHDPFQIYDKIFAESSKENQEIPKENLEISKEANLKENFEEKYKGKNFGMNCEFSQVLRFLCEDEEIEKYYNKVQFLLIKARLLSIHEGSQAYYSELFEYLSRISMENDQYKQEFACLLALSLKFLGFYDPLNLEIIDRILLKFAENRRNSFQPDEFLRFMNFISCETSKIQAISSFLLSLDQKKVNFAAIKKNLMEILPNLAQKILEKVFADSKIQEEEFENQDDKRIQALKWLFADKNHLEKAVILALKLIRNLISEEKFNLAKQVFREFLEGVFIKEKLSIKNELFEEFDCYKRFFLAEESFMKVFNEENSAKKNSSQEKNTKKFSNKKIGFFEVFFLRKSCFLDFFFS